MSQLLFDSEDPAVESTDIERLSKRSRFIDKCLRLFGHNAGYCADSMMIFQDDANAEKGYSAHHDDGFLHIIHNPSGLRASFDVQFNQTLSANLTNDNTMRILEMLGLKKLIGKSVLLDPDEDEDDDEYCSCCGRCK